MYSTQRGGSAIFSSSPSAKVQLMNNEVDSDEAGLVSKYEAVRMACQAHNCTEEAIATGKAAADIQAFASFTENKAQCNDDGNCGHQGLCITAKDQSKAENVFPKGKELKLCCRYGVKKEEELYRCLVDKPLKDTNDRIIKCSTDEDCNREEGRALRDARFWKYECVQSKSNEKHCCRAPHCNDDITFMRTELDCKTAMDCLRDEDDKSDVESRAICRDYNERNEKAKKKKCCPIGEFNRNMSQNF
ncbi:hypothetical protein ANCDUO_06909 [Ancylostoma duodenale]|uniref:Uncharacterized protein n=1 Tax=Ancylostoma duodenale TaxID=51022 RepID=A0A0C2GNE7_9BILA|nr:hypothetical protein ANCDUO_06909 [Ancylostoma duodenale]